jgi:hypothetical protein
MDSNPELVNTIVIVERVREQMRKVDAGKLKLNQAAAEIGMMPHEFMQIYWKYLD